MRLMNTIEVSPYDYEQGGYPNDLVPIYEGAWLFDVTTISDNALVAILQNELKDIDLSEFDEQVGALPGGVALEHDNAFVITPGCCGDVGAIHDWEEMLETPSASWQQLWIGHPWIYYRKSDTDIEFSQYTELGTDSLDELQILVRVPLSDLRTELARIRVQQHVFSKRIEVALEGLGMAHAVEIAKLMTAGL